ncbi:hypothetical protein [Microbacterium sp. 77mftsu3.1]|uniref:hypothetical protein n=1 Tax=Microbacterium sp. 77mftsu3.1 TaxID=1761802 RepID=UPI00037C69F0|nr:hypothetical protein [Microbacterium sp. 77mftsu3.1]SDG22980.1 hypothetical protein SAMN04488590_0255 [Microbacterium sp. 77mftsu3.1]
MGAEYTPKQVRYLFFDREGQCCFYCGRSLSWSLRGSMLAGGWSLHHRKGRRAGDTSYPNALILCGTGTTGCHGWVTEHPEEAFELGLAIRRLATTEEYEPARVRVRREDKTWWLLTERGQAREVEASW